MSTKHKSVLRKIPHQKLRVSGKVFPLSYFLDTNKQVCISSYTVLHIEPDPHMFGNERNDIKNPNWTNKNWLKSRFHFSFAEYSNSRNSAFGVLRVLNDDLVQPKRGNCQNLFLDSSNSTYKHKMNV
jgi:hypothetical protein